MTIEPGRLLFRLAALLLFPALALRGDQPDESQPFFAPQQAFDVHGVESINLYNGDLGIGIPLGPAYSLGPTGFAWQMRASASVKFWHFSSSTCGGATRHFAWISGDPTLGVGWALQMGYVVKRDPPDDPIRWEYYTADGGSHRVGLTANSGVTKDGSHLRVTALPDQNNPTSFTVESPDGVVRTFGHIYTRPLPTPPTSSVDFNNLDYGETATSRYGLSTIKDRFGNTLLTVNWSGTNPSEVASITLNPFGSTINFTWTSYGVGPASWRVLDYVTFPAPGGQQLKVDFAYQQGVFDRNNFDNSAGATGCTASGPTVNVPELASITTSDPAGSPSMSSFAYGFTYFPSPQTTPQKQGTILKMTLPTLGTVQYDYDITAGAACFIESGCDPNGSLGADLPDDPDRLTVQDHSPGLASRSEFEPFTGRTVVTTYTRKGFKGGHILPDLSKVFRRTTVIGPGNDDGSGPAQYARRYFFHVDDPESTTRNGEGVELKRLFFAGSDPTQPPIRSIVSCYQGQCGYQAADGTIYTYDFTADRTPPEKSVTWYGVSPAGQDGGTCTSSYTPQCTATTNTNYNATAGQYDTTAVTSTVAGGINRTVETNWTPNTAAGHWLLGLYDHQFTWGAGATPPAGSNGSSVVRQYFDFDPTNGFLKASWTWDSVLGKAIKRCQYRNADGTPLNDYSQTFSAVAEPTTDPCPGSIPSVGTDGDAFGESYTSSDLLLVSSNWRKGTGSIGWNIFDVTRDPSTGFVTENRDPNVVTNSTLKTVLTYDSLGRVVKNQPPGGSSVEWPTTFCYLPALVSGGVTYTDFVIVKKITASPTLGPFGSACARDDGAPGSGSGTVLAYQYDGLGRLVREIRRHHKALSTGSYFERRESRWDSAGHAVFESEWQPCPISGYGATSISNCAVPAVVNPLTAPGPSYAYSNFDPFGRVQHTVGPNHASDITISRTDGSIAFSDSREQITVACINGTWSGSTCGGGGTSSTTTNVWDALGRLTSVTEPGGADVTNYAYGVLNRVTGVTQGSQTRAYSYSAFGFAKTVKTPEDGASGNATANLTSYGSIGNLLAKTDGSPTVATYGYAYDAAGRLTRIQASVPGGTTDTYLVNCYDGSTLNPTCIDGTPNSSGGLYARGRLTRRIGWNRLPYQATPVTDDFVFSSGGVRLSSKITSVGTLGKPGFGAPVTQTWNYTTAGTVFTHGHPRASGSTTSMTDNPTFNSGFETNLSATSSAGGQQIVSANYQPSGTLADYSTGPSSTFVKTTITPDGLIPSRPGQIKAVNYLSQVQFDTGLYAYDGAGDVKSMGGDLFSYDSRTRLVSSNYTNPGGGTQGFVYDRYGNMTSKSGVNAITLTTSTTTNHLTGGIYDDRGNLTSFAPDLMFYDLLNRKIENINSTLGTDFIYIYDGGGERVGKFPSKAPVQRREMGRDVMDARNDTLSACASPPFTDVPVADNDCQQLKRMKEIGITQGCGNGAFCPDLTIPRNQAAVFFVKGNPVNCPVNQSSCGYLAPAAVGIFADVPQGDPYAPWIEELYHEGITAGCGVNGQGQLLYCPNDALTSWQMLAWLKREFPGHSPAPRSIILTYRDPDAQVTSEGAAASATGSNSFLLAINRDDFYLNGLLVGSAVWSGTTPAYQFYSLDHLGTPRLVTNTAAASVETRKYWPYGDDGQTTGGGAGQRIRFAEMERDDETSHYYDHARYEAFNIARFLTVDTGGGSLSNPQSLNLYVYSLDNPLKYKDPKGNDATIAVVVIVGSGLVEGISRVADYSVANPNASFTDYGRQFLIGFGGGAAAGAVAIVTTLGTHNPAIVGAAAAEADAIVEQKLEMWLGERTEWDALDVGLKTAGGAILGPVTEALVPRLGGPIPKYNKLRPLGDFIRKRNVNREVRKGLMDALLGGRMFAGVDAMTSNLSMSSIFGEGYDAFMRFLAEFDEQNSIPSGTVETGQGGFGICDEDPGHCDSKGKGDD